MKSISEASVVLLPEPVGPVTRNRPRGRVTIFLQISGTPSCSGVSSLLGICRSTIATVPRCLNTLTRNRARSLKAKPKSQPPFSASSAWHRSGVIAFMRPLVSSAVSTFVACGFMWPSTRNTGGRPAVMWMSLTPFFTAAVSSLSIWTVPTAACGMA